MVNLIGALTLNGDTFNKNTVTSGAGGNGGSGGNGGQGRNFGGQYQNGQPGAVAGVSGNAEGGAVFNTGGNVAVTSSTFTSNVVTSAMGGTGGAGGNAASASPISGINYGWTGGDGASGGNAGFARGGAISLLTGSLTVSSTAAAASSFTSNQVVGKTGGTGGVGGNGWNAGGGGDAGNGSAVYGGAISASDNAGNVTITGTAAHLVNFASNTITSGAGGTGGAIGTTFAGDRSGNGGNSGVAYGGGLSYHIAPGGSTTNNTVSITDASFSNNSVTTSTGGAPGATPWGNSGSQGSAGTAESPVSTVPAAFTGARGGGLAVVNETKITTVTVTSSTFTSNTLTGGNANGLTASSVFGGGIDLSEATAGGAATLTDSLITKNTIVGGANGAVGGNAEGGGIATYDYNLSLSSTSTTAPVGVVSGNTATAGQGGSGGNVLGGGISDDNGSLALSYMAVTGNQATSGPGNPSTKPGTANGGGIAATLNNASLTTSYSLDHSQVTNNTLTQGNGGNGPGATNTNQTGPAGGNAGSATNALVGADGAGVSLSVLAAGGTGNVTVSNSNLDGNSSTAGKGGTGGQGNGAGGAGGLGGAALGGGLFFNNQSANTTLNVAVTNSTASNNQITAGVGGRGGNSGTDDTQQVNHVLGGRGGDGGSAVGGGLYLLANNNSSVNNIVVSSTTLDGNSATGGAGGTGGAGYKANGGQGGLAAGGGVYNNSTTNTTKATTLALSGVTIAGNMASAGAGGNAGSGTTANGGDGGNGGNAGNVLGGGLNSTDHTVLTVINSTIGGQSSDPNNPNINFNILVAATGGRGGDGGTAGNSLNFANGGNGGNGSTLEGAGVYVNSGTATFINDTIDSNQAIVNLATASGGAIGAAAGSGGSPGTPGLNGTAKGGGYFAAGNLGTPGNPTINNVGNTIIELNTAGDTYSSSFVPNDTDVSGVFNTTGYGYNIIGAVGGAGGFATGTGTPINNNQINVTATLGPLQDNGGPTETEALLHTTNSPPDNIAMDTGNNSLITAALFGASPTDQRGETRIVNGTVDVGAFEVQTSASFPTITPTTATPPFILPDGTAGVVYNTQTITASGGTGTLTMTYAITSGAIPPGLTFTVNNNGNNSTLTITGTPTASGEISFTVTASDTNGDQATEDYTLTVNAGIVQLNPTSLPSGIVNSAYNQTIVASGGVGALSLTSSLTAGALPAGLSFSIVNNQMTISGTPTNTGSATFTVTGTDSETPESSTTQSYTLIINAVVTNISFNPTTIPVATVGVVYGPQTITANGALTVTNQITSGNIPPGMNFSISGNKLTLSGTPTVAGSVSFTLTATDSNGSQATQSYTLTVNAAGIAINFTPSSLPAGNVGTAYTQGITATGGVGALSLATTLMPADLPAGLSYSIVGATMSFSGTPTATGSVGFSITASDSGGDQTTQSYTLTVNPPGTISFSPLTLPDGTTGVFYNHGITASGGNGPLTVSYQFDSGTLPTGLGINIVNNQLIVSGTPTVSGSVTFTVSATDGTNTTTQNYTLTVDPGPLVFNPSNPTLPSGTTYSTYNQTITVAGGDGHPTVAYSVTGTVPAGLTLNATGDTLTISGTPTTAGTITIKVTATDSSGDNGSQTYTLIVNPTAITFNPSNATLPDGATSTAYSQTITASGGSGSVTVSYTIASGTLPTGLTIIPSGNQLIISGTPTSRRHRHPRRHRYRQQHTQRLGVAELHAHRRCGRHHVRPLEHDPAGRHHLYRLQPDHHGRRRRRHSDRVLQHRVRHVAGRLDRQCQRQQADHQRHAHAPGQRHPRRHRHRRQQQHDDSGLYPYRQSGSHHLQPLRNSAGRHHRHALQPDHHDHRR